MLFTSFTTPISGSREANHRPEQLTQLSHEPGDRGLVLDEVEEADERRFLIKKPRNEAGPSSGFVYSSHAAHFEPIVTSPLYSRGAISWLRWWRHLSYVILLVLALCVATSAVPLQASSADLSVGGTDRLVSADRGAPVTSETVLHVEDDEDMSAVSSSSFFTGLEGSRSSSAFSMFSAHGDINGGPREVASFTLLPPSMEDTLSVSNMRAFAAPDVRVNHEKRQVVTSELRVLKDVKKSGFDGVEPRLFENFAIQSPLFFNEMGATTTQRSEDKLGSISFAPPSAADPALQTGSELLPPPATSVGGDAFQRAEASSLAPMALREASSVSNGVERTIASADENMSRRLATYTVATSALTTANDSAAAGDTIVATPGTFTGICASDTASSFCVTEPLHFQCSDVAVKCTFDCQIARNCVYVKGVTGGTAAFVGFTLTKGKNEWGGGMYISSSTVALTTCSFTSNTAANGGGGAYIESSTITLTSSSFSSNTAGNGNGGGGMYIQMSTVTLTSCSFTSNTATGSSYGGGALFVDGSSSAVTLVACSITSNTATNNYTGGIYHFAGNTNLYGVLFSGNSASKGAADVYRTGGTITVYSTCPAGYTHRLRRRVLRLASEEPFRGHSSHTPVLCARQANTGRQPCLPARPAKLEDTSATQHRRRPYTTSSLTV